MAVTLFEAMLHAPLCAVSRRWPRVLHAVDSREICRVWRSGKTLTALCGTSRLRLAGDSSCAVLWPPRAKFGAFDRCRECWVLDGRRRPRQPRSAFRRAS